MPVTKRDRIWTAALHLRQATESPAARDQLDLKDGFGVPGFTVDDVQEKVPAPVAERTVRDCLNAMTELNELSARRSNPVRYRLPRERR